MIYAATRAEVEARRKAFIRKWRLKCRAVADSLEEAGDRLFTFTRFPPSQWKSIRTSNAIERLHEEIKRRIKTQTILPCAETAAMLFWALLASGQIVMRKVDGWQSLAEKPSDQIIDLAAYAATRAEVEARRKAFIRKWRGFGHTQAAPAPQNAGQFLNQMLLGRPVWGVLGGERGDQVAIFGRVFPR
jgi:hypothetical protein